MRAAVLGVLTLAGLPARATAQKGVIGGTVYRDTADHVLAGVEITIPALKRHLLSDTAGDFHFTAVPAGRYSMLFRHLGFAPLVDTVVVADDKPVDREYVLAEQAVRLDAVNTTAKERTYINPQYNDFLERVRVHNGGYFMTDSLLRKNEDRQINDILTSYIPGITTFLPNPKNRPTAEYISSGSRGGCARGGQCATCPVTLYLDGHLVFAKQLEPDKLNWPDIRAYRAVDYAGVEYYPGGASTPSQFNATVNTCGVLLLWSRAK
jgi:CarboxypepD_reg-like domain